MNFFRSFKEVPVTMILFVIHFILYFAISAADPNLSQDTLIRYGAHYNPSIWSGEYYRLITSALLHGGFLHILLNNLALWNLGEVVERITGSAFFLVMYVVTLLMGNFFSLVYMPPMAVGVGASGAIMGIAGFLCAVLLFDRDKQFLSTRRGGKLFFFILVALNFVVGELIQVINNAAHFGGFIAGVACGIYFWAQLKTTKLPKWIGFFAFLALLAGFFALGYKSFTEAPRIDPKVAKGGIEQLLKKNPTKAMEILKKWNKGKKSELLLYFQGQMTIQQGKWVAAEKVYSTLTTMRPKNREYWMNLLLSISKQKKEKQADLLFQKLAKRFAKGRRSTRILALLLSARCRDREAIALYQQMIEEAPRDPSLHNDLAWLLVKTTQADQGNPRLALYHAELAVQVLSFRSAALLDTLATVYFALGQYEKAFQTIQDAFTAYGAKEILPHLTLQRLMIKKAMAKKKTTKKKTTKK